MLKTLLSQTGWSMAGSIYGFALGFFVKLYLINAIGTESYGKFVIGQSVVAIATTFLAFALPQVLLRFLPAFVEKGENEKASDLASFGLQFLLAVGFFSAVIVATFHEQLSSLFHDSDELLSSIIMISALYIPLTLYSAVITASYRSLLKIKEIILYSTFLLITTRAILVFLVFHFTDDVLYFLYIEIFSHIIVLTIMTVKFDTSKFTFFKHFPIKEILKEGQVVKFGKKMYFYTIIGFAGGYTITLIMSISLPASEVGVYAILTTIAGLTAFLLNNLNSIFAPVISKYHAADKIEELGNIFKETTFIINILSAPFIILLVLFSKDILALYGHNVESYTAFLTVLLIGSYYNLFVGNSGMLLLMGGWENDEIMIKIANMLFVIVLSIVFISEYGILAAVWISTISAIFANTLHVIFINKRFGFTPWEINSFVVFAITLTVILIFGFGGREIQYSFFDYLWIGILTPLLYWIPFYKKIAYIVNKVRRGD